GPKMIVESPIAHAFAQYQQFWSVTWIAAVGHHAVERRKILECLPPRARIVANTDAWAVAHRKHIRAAEGLTGPLCLDLDFRIARKLRARRDRQAKIDGITVVVARKSELQGDRRSSPGALNLLLASLHSARELLGARPQRRL